MIQTYLLLIETDADKSKFERIYTEYRELMFRVANARLHHTQDAEDAVHHAFMKIAENIQKIEPVSPKTKQLVVTIVDNRVTDMLRVRGRHPEVQYEDALLHSLSTQIAEEDILTQCIFKLPDKQRKVIWLRYHHGYSLHEIAKLLGISLVWAQKIDQRAKKKLKELYEEGGGKI